jgi:tRNA(Ile)-lysidine synthase
LDVFFVKLQPHGALIDSRRFLRKFPASHRYLIGVSGGRDSVALLQWLRECGYAKLIVCHLEHGLRGTGGRADARFVAGLAEQHEMLCEIGTTDVRGLAAREKLSIETAARTARYAFFAKIVARRRCHTIFLAHHADDLVETFLINLFRGAGTAGLSSLREISSHRIGRTELTVVRPLLSVWRRQINEYIRANRIAFREDQTNKELGPLRNRIRHRVIPYLEKVFGRNIRQSIWRAAMIAADENEWINALIDQEIPSSAELSVERLRKQPVAVQRRVLQKWLRQHEVADVGYDLIERVRELLAPGHSVAKTNLPSARYVRRRAKKIFIE